MNLGLIIGKLGWHALAVEQAAHHEGHTVVRIDLRAIQAKTTPNANRDLRCDAMLVRGLPTGSFEQITLRMDWLKMQDSMGIPMLNRPAALEACIDKWETSWRLHEAGLPTPSTCVCQTTWQAHRAFEHLGNDVVIKPLFGSQGKGVQRFQSKDLFIQECETRIGKNEVIYLQQYIQHPPYDLRLLVLAGQVIGAMKRHIQADWRSNIALGAKPEAHLPTAKETELALAAVQTLGAGLAGVDLLPTLDGQYQIIEVNGVPGWQALQSVHTMDLAQYVVKEMARRVSRSG